MFNKCAVNALFGRPGRMRKVKCDNRNEEKGHFLCPALGTDVITAAYHLVCAVWGSTEGHNAGDCGVKVDQLNIEMTSRGKRKKLLQISQAFHVWTSIIIPAVMPAVCCVNMQLWRSLNKLSQGTSNRKYSEKAPKVTLFYLVSHLGKVSKDYFIR